MTMPVPLALLLAWCGPAHLTPASAAVGSPAATNTPASVEPSIWQSLSAGASGWVSVAFGGEGELAWRDGVVVLPCGQPFTGMRYTNPVPTMDYEISLEARRVSGTDFFCGLTVPVGDSHCSLIVGGWGGGLVGISSLDGMDASENETLSIRAFEPGRWYRIRLRITPDRIAAWIDDERVVNVKTTGRTVGLRPGAIESCRPLGVCSYDTEAEVRAIQLRRIQEPATPPGAPGRSEPGGTRGPLEAGD